MERGELPGSFCGFTGPLLLLQLPPVPQLCPFFVLGVVSFRPVSVSLEITRWEQDQMPL